MARGCRVWRLYILKGEKPADLLVQTPVKSTCGSQDCQSTRRRGAGHAAPGAVLAHRVISLLRSNLVVSGVKRTSITEPNL